VINAIQKVLPSNNIYFLGKTGYLQVA